MKILARVCLCSIVLAILVGCASHKPMPTVDYVDLNRFMGDWYVIAHIPVYLEAEAWNALENYSLDPDGRRINTEFTFNQGGFDGPRKAYYPIGFVKRDSGNAKWGMQFVWPLKSDYRIVHLSDDYEHTIIGRQKRDYVWIMSRQPIIDPVHYDSLVAKVQVLGYDVSQLRQVPQQAIAER